MEEKMISKQKTPSLLGACITLLGVCISILAGLRLGIGAPMSLFLGTVVAIAAALFYRVPWETIQKRFMKVIGDSLIPILILMCVGIMVGAWLIGGTVPSLSYFAAYFYTLYYYVCIFRHKFWFYCYHGFGIDRCRYEHGNSSSCGGRGSRFWSILWR